jgi:phage terminase small subunit
MPLTPKQQRFIQEYLIDLNATQAAIRAGYGKKGASTQGERLLRNVEIKAAVAAGQARQFGALEITAERVKLELARVAFVDVRRLFDDDGNLRPLSTLSADDVAAVKSLEVVMANLDAGDGKRDRVHRVSLHDKTRALEMLAKHFGLLKEQVEVSLVGEIVERLVRARARIKP